MKTISLIKVFTPILLISFVQVSLAQNLTVEGNVGIGTDTPSKALTVIGDVKLANSDNSPTEAIINAFTGGDTNSILDFNLHPDGDNTAQIRLFRTTNVTTAPVIFHVLKGNNSTAVNAQIAGNNAHTYFAKDYGNVGIGTANPTSILHIEGSTPTLKILDPGLSVGQKSSFRIGKAQSDNQSIGIEFKYSTPQSAASFHMWGDNFGDALTIQKGGNVGLGTDIPAQSLDIDGNILMAKATYPSFLHAGGDLVTSSDGDIGLVADANDTDGTAPGNIYFGSGSNFDVDANPDFSFEQAFGQPIHPRNLHMIIEGSTGFVGIGKSNPNTQLDVEGTSDVVKGSSSGIGVLRGIYGYASGFTAASSSNVYGVYGLADSGGGGKFGVYGAATHNSNVKYGVYGYASGSSTNYAGYFAGNLRYTGTLTGPSDKKLKKNISMLKETTSILRQLNPVVYQFDQKELSYLGLPTGEHYGFIAQELEKVLPELVEETVHPTFSKEETPDGIATPEVRFKSINYIELIPILTKVIQEQQVTIEQQETNIEMLRDKSDYQQTEIRNLETRLTKIEMLLQSKNKQKASTSNILLTTAKLESNHPNPFTENTLISYHIPQNVHQAQLRITNSDGKVIKEIPITVRGQGQTLIEAQSLNAGNYYYTLFLNGHAFETKQMVLTRN